MTRVMPGKLPRRKGSPGPVEDLREANRRGRDRISQNCDIVEPGL